ncbi:D-alanyl-D-alanine carboxypeptidase/D-alanyl-D-alanine-endopeptidase [Maritimibacter sp. 55A14]|uniref:D-alanyl-D-alanine carboxypeptidase/D-alanyl-D-alanine endopeptidase n=1 Tax=Maritimibacter sp. 55A14 TaxID=2174844 RepID=UPI000D60ED40|nr:D-alanyl-D-alanine carboxypeptidase/D-alanyl-D-alanine-endopeptidase [Maritimibacter sp. 55A14]PWE29297.1 D-alanyl-D-alanine carboxypeptidase/D-alanyl-D-alanine-endopeptidase [Maritimibacter sp. 55A14]
MARNDPIRDPLRRSLLAGLMSILAAPVLANAPTASLRPLPRDPDLRRRSIPRVEALVDAAGLTGRVTYAVADADTGEMLETRAPLLGQPPASVAKALTTLYALETLGPAYRFRTRLIGTGPVEDGVLKGDLVLQGGGDPTLDTDAVAAMVRDLKAFGLRRIDGRLLVDADALPHLPQIDPGQPDHAGYNAALSGLNLNYNRVFFEWKRNGGDYDLTMDARSASHRPAVRISRMEIVDRTTPVYTYSADEGRDVWTVSRKALGKGGGRWLPVRRPEGYAAEVFHTVARAEGLSVPRPQPGVAPEDGAVLAQYAAPELSDLLLEMLKYSTNLTAEVVGLTATRARGGPGDTLAASAGAMSDWLAARYGARRAELVDHSGLGGASRVSAQSMVQVLCRAGWDGPLRTLLKPVAFRDDKGRPMRAHPVQAMAKTGTLNFVSGLAGYMKEPGGRRMVFAIFAADPDRRAAIPPEYRDRPPGARPWAVRARRLQHRLIERWAQVYGA